MLKYIFKRLRRSPAPAIGVVLFAAIVAAALCGLHAGNVAAQQNYEEIYRQIPVTCVVTDQTGERTDGLNIPRSAVWAFTRKYITTLSDMLTDVQIKGSQSLDGDLSKYTLTGITSTGIATELWLENGCVIDWADGYDESLFQSGENACIVPEVLLEDYPESACSLEISLRGADGAAYEDTMLIAGTYYGGSGRVIYCSWDRLVEIWAATGMSEQADSIRATLRDNDQLEAFREAASMWFAEPDRNAAQTSWEALALDINDSQLRQASQSLQNSLKVNRLSTYLIFAFSVCAGFLIGFLMIRQRRREIALMRTMGTPDRAVWASFTLEQMLCVILGAAIGGAYFRWVPIGRLAVFAVVFFVGLNVALLIFLRSRLLTAIKEEE